MASPKIPKVFSRILIALLIIVTLPAWSLFGGDRISSDTRDILKSHFPYRNVVNHLLNGNPNNIQRSFPNLNLEYVQGGERSGAKQELYRSAGRSVMLISQMIAGGRVIFVGAAKSQNNIPVRKLIKASHDSNLHKTNKSVIRKRKHSPIKLMKCRRDCCAQDISGQSTYFAAYTLRNAVAGGI
mgnify:CR=1 FL=1